MWILILTLVTMGVGVEAHAPSIASVPGFTTEQYCMLAGQAWLRQQAINQRASAICVKA